MTPSGELKRLTGSAGNEASCPDRVMIGGCGREEVSVASGPG